MLSSILKANGQIDQHQNAVDPAFQCVSKTKPGFFIWRVENMQLNTIPKESYGLFFKGDTYLVYYASETNRILSQHIHLWIGSESTTDEQGVGAFKMVELDDYLTGSPIQHRECQNHESERFLSYFKQRGGFKYQNGGAASGFHHYEKCFEPRIFQVKGKRNVRMNELNHIDWSSLNRNDSFLIDLNSTIFIWNGRNANKYEKLQAMYRAKQFRDERNDNCNIVVVEDGEEKDLPKDELKLFESKFPLKDKVSRMRTEAVNTQLDDLKFEKELSSYLKLYKCSDAQNEEDGTVKIRIVEQKTGPLYKEDLNSEDSFIVDNGKSGIWVWIGKKSSNRERKEAMRNALGFLQAKGYDERQQNSIKVTRVIDGCEPVEFKALFNRWIEPNESSAKHGLARPYSINSIAKSSPQAKFDASLLHSNPHLAADSQMVDNGKGTKEIWVVKNFDIESLSLSKYGQFHSGDCYIIHYKYQLNNSEKHIFYYWIGKKSSLDEQGTAALKTIEMDNKLCNGAALQVRVNEAKEPVHFMAMFNGLITIYQGGNASGFKNVHSNSQPTPNTNNYMLQIKSFGHQNMKAFQVEYKTSSLNSNDAFVISYENSNKFYVWYGKGSTGDEREAAKSLVIAHKKEPEIVIESQEKEDFWKVFPDGKQAYHSEKRLQNSESLNICRLFEITNVSGRIGVNEIYQFTQEDLNTNEVMLLDAWDSMFIWIGKHSNEKEREEANKIAIEYLKSCPSNRGADIPIYRVKQGLEPPNFTGFFGPWDSEVFNNQVDYNCMKKDLHSKNQPHLYQLAIKDKSKTINNNNPNAVNNQMRKQNGSFKTYPKYTYDELIKPADQLPQDVLSEFKELHLTEEDFKTIFQMSYENFVEKPLWKQKELKRSARLF